MATALLGLGLVLVVEGLLYAVAPGMIDDLLTLLRSMPTEMRRLVGLGALALGVSLIWLAKSLGA